LRRKPIRIKSDEINPDVVLNTFRIVYENKPAKILTFVEDTSAKTPSLSTLSERVHKVEDRLDLTDSKIEDLEFQINISKFRERIDKVEDFVSKLFAVVNKIRNVSYQPTEEGLRIIVIHEFEDRIEVIEQTEKIFRQIEDTFPEIHFEPIILHLDEFESDSLKKTRTILQR